MIARSGLVFVAIDGANEGLCFQFAKEAIALDVGPDAQPCGRIFRATRRLPFPRQIVDVAQDHDDTIDCPGRIAIRAHAVDQLGNCVGLDFVESKPAELWQDVNTQYCLVRLPTTFVCPHIRQIAFLHEAIQLRPASRVVSAAGQHQAVLPPQPGALCDEPAQV